MTSTSVQIGTTNPILRAQSTPIKQVDKQILELAQILHDMMREYDGVGLAAPQLGHNIRMVCITEWKKKKGKDECIGERILLNPEIVDKSKDMITDEEGCVSLPGVTANVQRHRQITVTFMDLQGRKSKRTYTGLTAAIVQHEIDHLNGILFTDRVK